MKDRRGWLPPAFVYGAALCGILVLLWGRGGPLGPRDAVWARIQREGVLRVGLDASFPPFESLDAQGQFYGLDVDLASALAGRWSVRAQFVNLHVDGLYDALRLGRCDLLISALPYDRTLTRDVLYSQSYLNAGQVLIVRASETHVQGATDLGGRKVAVELGSEAHHLMRQIARDKGLEITVVTQRESAEALALLRAGEADAVVSDRVTAYGWLARFPDLRVVGVPLSDEPYVIAARADATVLMEHVNAALIEWQANSRLEALRDRWLR